VLRPACDIHEPFRRQIGGDRAIDRVGIPADVHRIIRPITDQPRHADAEVGVGFAGLQLVVLVLVLRADGDIDLTLADLEGAAEV